MIKIVFSDFDETLLNYHSDKNYFDDYQVEVLRNLKESGILFCIVTGRSVNFFDKFNNILPYVNYIISSNGAYIYDVMNKKCIYTKYIGFQEVSDIYDYVGSHKYKLFYNSNGIQYKDNVNVDYNSCEQLIMSFDKDRLEEVLSDIDDISYVSYNNICRHDDRYTIDVNDYRVSKGNGVKYLCEYLDINLDETIGFGDSDNDLSMFDVVGKSIAVGNAIDKVRNSANNVILSCEEDGVFKYIANNLLGR